MAIKRPFHKAASMLHSRPMAIWLFAECGKLSRKWPSGFVGSLNNLARSANDCLKAQSCTGTHARSKTLVTWVVSNLVRPHLCLFSKCCSHFCISHFAYICVQGLTNTCSVLQGAGGARSSWCPVSLSKVHRCNFCGDLEGNALEKTERKCGISELRKVACTLLQVHILLLLHLSFKAAKMHKILMACASYHARSGTQGLGFRPFKHTCTRRRH